MRTPCWSVSVSVSILYSSLSPNSVPYFGSEQAGNPRKLRTMQLAGELARASEAVPDRREEWNVVIQQVGPRAVNAGPVAPETHSRRVSQATTGSAASSPEPDLEASENSGSPEEQAFSGRLRRHGRRDA